MTRRILHVVHTVELGLAMVARLAADQVARGWDVTLACSDDSSAAEWRARAPEIRQLTWNAVRGPGLGTVREVAALQATIRETRPDLVHLHSSKAGMAGRLALRGSVPTVFQPHAWSFEAVSGTMGLGALAWERRAARWADVIVCVSEAERRRGVRAGIRAEYRVIPTAVDLAALRPADDDDRRESRKRLGLEPDRPLVVCIGRLSRQKGQDILLEAWPVIEQAVPGAALALVGEGPEREALAARSTASVTFAGLRDDVQDWIAAADVVAQPSRWEGMPLVVLEAMARARSVVAAAADGVREALPPAAGAIVPPDDPMTLGSRIVERLRDSAQATAEGRAGRAHVEAHHDLKNTFQSAARLYDEVLEARDTPGRIPRYDPSAEA